MNRKIISDKEWLNIEHRKKKKAEIKHAFLSALLGLIIIALVIYYHKIAATKSISESINGYQYWIYISILGSTGLALLINSLMKIGEIRRKYY